jgi:hypothetical protein
VRLSFAHEADIESLSGYLEKTKPIITRCEKIGSALKGFRPLTKEDLLEFSFKFHYDSEPPCHVDIDKHFQDDLLKALNDLRERYRKQLISFSFEVTDTICPAQWESF